MGRGVFSGVGVGASGGGEEDKDLSVDAGAVDFDVHCSQQIGQHGCPLVNRWGIVGQRRAHDHHLARPLCWWEGVGTGWATGAV